MIDKVLFSKNSDEWETPQHLYDRLNNEFEFDYDICASHQNTKVKTFYTTKDQNSLDYDWSMLLKDENNFEPFIWCNPPYSKIGEFVKKAYEESLKGCTVVMLIPRRTDTKYWKENFNKEWSSHLIDLKRDLTEGFVTNAITKNSLFQFEKSEGLHCIAAGMNWPPTDLESMLYLNKINKKEWIRAFKPCIDNLNKQKKLWDKSVKSSPSFYSFMKDHIYGE